MSQSYSSINQKLSSNSLCIRKSSLLRYGRLTSVSWAFIKIKHTQIFLFLMNLIFDLDCSKGNNLSNSREMEVSRLYEDSEFGSQYRVTLWLTRDLLPCLRQIICLTVHPNTISVLFGLLTVSTWFQKVSKFLGGIVKWRLVAGSALHVLWFGYLQFVRKRSQERKGKYRDSVYSTDF